ncbi:DUF3027 domain-containing protein [Streptacidiphilus sp. P02-A3a]|uniref:DUF3027 domain-containing protein n=1 Tax=Streptacidiphilus sp. P02-A3a TaxID=2704468 RepID=UPI0015FBA6A2|nr:DUF3027 domain-containing protein [Streptacidiphilus sp. P02-A3a]QMU67498.1 DUF3027 domain-containing protein [Streptacidiphilus sp. P02-A3a]
MSAATTRSRTPDRLCAEAVDFARAAAVEAAGAAAVGEHLGVDAEGERVVTHYFATKEWAYRGWRWAVTVTRASRGKQVTLDETVLLPGQDALVAPQWVPWSERLRPGDMGPGDLLPTDEDDLRLEPGWSGADEPAPNSALVAAAEALVEDVTAAEAESGELATPTARGAIAAVAEELGLGRARVLSRLGLHLAADRWEKDYGAQTPMAQAAPASCATCGFLVPVAGSLSQTFGICANEFGPADGRVVALDYGCGGHSEAAVVPTPQPPAPPVLDEFTVEPMPLHPDPDSGSVTETDPAEELGYT